MEKIILNCPKCRTESMVKETYEGVEIDRCPACKGLYLDSGELKELIAKKMGNTADTLVFSATSDHMDPIKAYCLRCNKYMNVMVGPGKIRVDLCPNCKAVFLDQGELASIQLYKA